LFCTGSVKSVQLPVGSPIAVVYLRVSSAAQEDNTSLETQLNGDGKDPGCLAYCAEQGYTVLDVFQDVHSGADLERPGLEQALATIRAHKAGVLVAHTLDRVSRNQDHQGFIYTTLKLHGGDLETAKEKLDNSIQGQIMRTVGTIAAQIERDRLIERTGRGRRARATLKGAPLAGGVPLYGYQWADEGKTRLLVHPETGPIAQRIYSEITQGRSLRAIAKGLTDDGIPTPSQAYAVAGSKRMVSSGWNAATVCNIAKNPAYKGEAATFQKRFKKVKRLDPETGLMRTYKQRLKGDSVRLPDGTVPALVSTDQWAQVYDRLELNKTELAGNVSDACRNLLLRSGFIFCAHCGRKMHAGKQVTGARRYMCGSHSSNASGTCAGHTPATIPAEPMETDVWDRVVRALNTNAMAHALLSRETGSNGALDGLQARVVGYDANLKALVQQYKNKRRQQETAIDDDEFNELQRDADILTERIKSVRAERDDIAKRIERLQGRSVVHDLVTGLLWDVPVDAPKLGQPGHWTAVMEARKQLVGSGQFSEERGQVVREKADKLSLEDKRAILRWLGVRVEVYRAGESGPSGQRWELTFEGSEGAPLLSSTS
jgi:DNA invertase Pin-like site-specific DNA recombinase